MSDEAAGRALTLLHLSDLHFGPGHRFGSLETQDGDTVKDGGSLLDSLLPDVLQTLDSSSIDCGPLLVCITGDLSDQAQLSQFEEAAEFVAGLLDGLGAFSPAVVIVPGNHDVAWEEATPLARMSRWASFTRDYLKVPTVGEPDNMYALAHTGLAASHGASVIAINSAAFVKKDQADEKRGRLSDAGLKQLEAELEKFGPPGPDLRIALMHHHPILIPDLAEPGRKYDAVVEGGDILRLLRQYGFHAILHGHKHLPFHFAEDSRAAYATTQPREQRPIMVVCGGSTSAKEVSEKMQTPTNFYNLIRMKWLSASGECRSLIEPRQLVRHDGGAELPKYKWRWEPCIPDDRYHRRPPTNFIESDGAVSPVPFKDSGVDDTDRVRQYSDARGSSLS
jgi:3',5'-cyclic AMP phosphodiesterase CpdA